MRSIIVNPFTPIAKSEKSHVRGWAMLWAQRLNADIANKDSSLEGYDRIYIEHGVNFSGSMNLFGGFNDEVFQQVIKLMAAAKSGAKLFSLDWDIDKCDYVAQVEKRVGAKTTASGVDIDFIMELDDVLSSVENYTMADLGLPKLILGDSHSGAFSLPEQAIGRINGQLLHSAMRTPLLQFAKDNGAEQYQELTFCLGSIDIRFHTLRLNLEGPEKLAEKYAQQLIEVRDKLEIPIAACAPVPIEFEGRRIPKTGQYNGVNFNGSRQERLDYTLGFTDVLDDYWADFALITPPQDWYKMDGEHYAKCIMEAGSSVHIAPINYNSIEGWSEYV